jgi:crotonobetainyl-CoA:carnitine CoA-transferase CaiB-like acyl-CoA transferase
MASLSRADKEGPLSGVRVLDLTHLLAGPYCTMILADLGAEVWKVEPPGGEVGRRIGPRRGDLPAYFASVNRGKKSLAVDLRRPEGREIVLELARRADVFVENFRPGVLARLGLGPEALRRENPRLVYASITGFGQDGPRAQEPALDIVVQALGGLLSVTGQPGGPPVRPGVSLGDSVAGMFAAAGILAALYRRERTGEGDYLDLAMLDSQVTLMENALARYFATGQVPRAEGTRHPAVSPFRAFATADGHLVVAILPDDARRWEALCRILGRPELTREERFREGAGRLRHREALEGILEDLFRRRSTEEWLGALRSEGIPCAPVQDVAQVTRDPQVRHRGAIREIPDGLGGRFRVADTPFRFRGARTGPQGAPPAVGEHTEEILREVLGWDAERLARLRRAAVLGSGEEQAR